MTGDGWAGCTNDSPITLEAAAIATVGFGGKEMADNYRKIREAQLAVGDPDKHPEFAGNVRTVDPGGFLRERNDASV